MAFVTRLSGQGEYVDPIATAHFSGLGAASDAAIGAAAGSVIPGVGTAAGGVIGTIVSLFGNLFGGGDKTGLPRQPIADPNFAQQLGLKWFYLYLNHAPSDGGAYWQGQLQQDGAPRAWANFSTSPEPVAAGVAAKAVQLAPVYGGPFVLSPVQIPGAPQGAGSTTPNPPSAASSALSASVLGTLTPTTLFLGAGLVVGLLLMPKHTAPNPRRRRRHR